jgi:nicotinamide mononucleotide transporter PnuC
LRHRELEKMHDRIGKYKILSQLGEGGMGTVYLGKHEILGRLTAVKVMRREISGDAEFHKRFLQEARTTAQLQHPNIIHIYDMDEEQVGDDALYFIAMEFITQDGVHGRTLQDVLNEREKNAPAPSQESVDMFLRVFSQLCSALAYAHSKNILHCDIKPANVLIDESGSVKLSDFGLARIVRTQALRESTLGALGTRQSSNNAQNKSIEGTFLYMPPEVQEGGDWTKPGDVYSLGAVIYRLLTGKRPVGRWRNPCETVKTLPSWCGDLLEKCLSNLEERYEDGQKLFSACEEFMSKGDAARDDAPKNIAGDPKLRRAFILLSDGEFAKADECFERILDHEPDSAKAYIGKLMAKLGVREEGQLADYPEALSEYNDYRRAMRFANEDYREILKGYNEAILERLETERKKKAYQEALSGMKSADTKEDFREVSQKFGSVRGYRDADVLAAKCEKIANEMGMSSIDIVQKTEAERQSVVQTQNRKHGLLNLTPYEKIWFGLFCLLGIIAPGSWNTSIAFDVAKMWETPTLFVAALCNIFYALLGVKGLRLNYVLGILSDLAYFIGDEPYYTHIGITTYCLAYLPSQLVGFYVWSKNTGPNGIVAMRKLSEAKLLICFAASAAVTATIKISSFGKPTGLLEIAWMIFTAFAVLLRTVCFRECWLFYMMSNSLFIVLTFTSGQPYDLRRITIATASLINSIYGIYIWYNFGKKRE